MFLRAAQNTDIVLLGFSPDGYHLIRLRFIEHQNTLRISYRIVGCEVFVFACIHLAYPYKYVTRSEQDGMDVGEHTAGSDCDATEQLVELLIVADGELDVPRDDAALLVVAGGVASELEDLGGKVLEDGGEVHGGTSANSLGVAASTELTGDPANGELKSSAGTAGDGSAGSSLSFSLILSFSSCIFFCI